MPPLPKRKTSKARKGERQSHLRLIAPGLAECPQCHGPRLPHHVCPRCGHYNGREAVKIRERRPRSQSPLF